MDQPGTIIHLDRDPERRGAPAAPEPLELRALDALTEAISSGSPLDETLDVARQAITVLLQADRVEFVLRGAEHPTPTNGSSIVVPLVADGEVFATCHIVVPDGRTFSDRDVASARRIATLAGVAMHAEAMHAAERRRRGELEAMLRVSESVTRSLDVDRVLQSALEESLTVTGLEAGAVYLVDEERGDLVRAAYRGGTEELVRAGARLPSPGSVLGDVVAEARPRLIRDFNQERSFHFQKELEASGHTKASAVAAPLIWEDQVIGVISLGTFGPRELDREELSFLIALSRPIAVAIGNARIFQNLKQSDGERRDLLAALVTAQEDERRAISEDIHDDTIQVMSAVAMRLSTLRFHRTDPELLGGIDDAAKATSDAIDRLRNLMFALHPSALEREGVGPALRIYLRKTFGRLDPVWDLEDGITVPLPAEFHITLYRIAIEALANVRKHANADRVRVDLGHRDGGVFVRVADNGDGIEAPDGESPPGHLGLTTMRKRARMAGGTCSMQGEPGGGTTVECWLPLDGRGAA